MRNIEIEYLGLLAGVLYGGKNKEDRTGTGTRSVFGRMLRHDMALGFPVITTKKIYVKNAITELLWILSGRTDLAYLVDNGVNYWNDDYNRSKRRDGTLGPVYGKQWRNFSGVDQLRNAVMEIRDNPASRRIMVTSWNPVELPDMVLPPCHYGFQVYCRDGQIDLMWQQRSADLFLGVPYDIVMYGLLLEMLAKGANMKAGKLICSLGDCHLYNNHIDQAKLQLSREPNLLPTLELNKGLEIIAGANNFLSIPSKNDINIKNYKHHDPIKAKLSVGQ